MFWDIVISIIVFFFVAVLSVEFAKEYISKALIGLRKPFWIPIFFIISGVFLIWGLVDIFTMKNFVNFMYFLTRSLVGFIFMLCAVFAIVGKKDREKWTERINRAYGGELGAIMKEKLPNDSPEYWADDEGVTFLTADNRRLIVRYKSLGYENIPVHYSDAVCRWLQNNIVKNGDNYIIKEEYYTSESWEGGSSDYFETTATSTGYTTKHVSGDPGHLVTERVTLGYKLIHKDLEAIKRRKKQLKGW